MQRLVKRRCPTFALVDAQSTRIDPSPGREPLPLLPTGTGKASRRSTPGRVRAANDRMGTFRACVRTVQPRGTYAPARGTSHTVTRVTLSNGLAGSALGDLLEKPWPRQAVSAAELGKRSLGAAELVAIAQVLRTSPTYLLTPPAGVGEIAMPSGATVNRDLLFALVTTASRDDLNLAAAEQTLDILLERAVQNQEDAAGIVSLARDLELLITRKIILGPPPPDVDPKELRAQPLFTESPGDWHPGPAEEEPLTLPVVAAIVTSPLGVLVGRRHDGKPPWTFIAGEQDAVKDENPADTAVREVKEETGLRIVAGEVIGERVHPKTGRTMIYVAAKPAPRAGTSVIVGDTDELAEVRWIGLAEADELLPGMFEPVREHLEREIGGTA